MKATQMGKACLDHKFLYEYCPVCQRFESQERKRLDTAAKRMGGVHGFYFPTKLEKGGKR